MTAQAMLPVTGRSSSFGEQADISHRQPSTSLGRSSAPVGSIAHGRRRNVVPPSPPVQEASALDSSCSTVSSHHWGTETGSATAVATEREEGEGRDASSQQSDLGPTTRPLLKSSSASSRRLAASQPQGIGAQAEAAALDPCPRPALLDLHDAVTSSIAAATQSLSRRCSSLSRSGSQSQMQLQSSLGMPEAELELLVPSAGSALGLPALSGSSSGSGGSMSSKRSQQKQRPLRRTSTQGNAGSNHAAALSPPQSAQRLQDVVSPPPEYGSRQAGSGSGSSETACSEGEAACHAF